MYFKILLLFHQIVLKMKKDEKLWETRKRDAYLIRLCETLRVVRKFPRAATEESAELVTTDRYQPQVYTRF